CADDHPLTREGIVSMVDRQRDMEVVASASTAEEAIERFSSCRPDITLMDLRMPEIGGLEAIRAIRAIDDHARIIVLTTYRGDEDVFRALQAGAATYLSKDLLCDDLPRIIREVHDGQCRIPSDVESLLASRTPSSTLTTREVRVMELIARGCRNKELARELGISEETVKVHVKHILAKLGVSDRTAAVTVAARRGFIHVT
ncbi:MAG: response regulator transcription factor, partial [Acidimicrobiia bacterium]|nr:response regulator transcription factor [Acidimicrobiia bacterium]